MTYIPNTTAATAFVCRVWGSSAGIHVSQPKPVIGWWILDGSSNPPWPVTPDGVARDDDTVYGLLYGPTADDAYLQGTATADDVVASQS